MKEGAIALSCKPSCHNCLNCAMCPIAPSSIEKAIGGAKNLVVSGNEVYQTDKPQDIVGIANGGYLVLKPELKLESNSQS